jgi:hypothetical protein
MEMTTTTETSALLTRDQAITNLIGSVALEETALANILQAEGEKIKAVIAAEDVTTDEIMCVNKSVQSMTGAITMLEIVLKTKLDLVSCEICPQCTQTNDEEDK